MPSAPLKPEAVTRFILACVVLSPLCAALFAVFPHITWIRIAGAFGFHFALWGLGLGLWCGLRLRETRCYLAAVLSVPSIALWVYLINWDIHNRLR